MKFRRFLYFLILLSGYANAQTPKPPMMGWSSWNNFRVNIDEEMIREQADAMVSSGLFDAGYRYVNIDDGFFGGRAASGKLFANNKKFPSGLRSLTNYIHGKNLMAGIYSDGGNNTCGSIYDNDAFGIGVGMFGHVNQDCNSFFKEWNFDFIKIDWCGGKNLKLDIEKTYSAIIDTARMVRKDVSLNICRWQFPGEWITKKADSWRISTDIRPNFTSVLRIIDINSALSKYASAGHYNDMDMLEVGNGMSYDEDKSHFSMWCMLNSPLLTGNDLRKMSKETISILTNREVIALNQDNGFRQAVRIESSNGIEVWIKPLGVNGKTKGIAVLNRNNNEQEFDLDFEKFMLDGKAELRDLWSHQDLGIAGKTKHLFIPGHGIFIFKLGKT